MDLQIFIRGVENDGGLRSFAEERFLTATTRFSEHILKANVRLEDVTGPDKGGIDKLCSLDVKLRAREIVIKEQGDDFHAAINTALDRLKTALSRETAKAKRGVGEG